MTMKTRMALAAGLGVLLAASCNGTVTTDPPGSGGAGGGAVTTNSATTTASAEATTGNGGAGSTGSGDTCPGFEDAKSTTPVTVRFHNNTGVPLYFLRNCSDISYEIHQLGNGDGVLYAFDPTCVQTCAELQTQPIADCESCVPTAYVIPAGGTHEMVWNGTGLKPVLDMPPACFFQQQDGYYCDQIISAAPTTYTLIARAFASCSAGCVCDANGECTGSIAGADAYADPVTFGFPGESVVDVVFGACAFGCPPNP